MENREFIRTMAQAINLNECGAEFHQVSESDMNTVRNVVAEYPDYMRKAEKVVRTSVEAGLVTREGHPIKADGSVDLSMTPQQEAFFIIRYYEKHPHLCPPLFVPTDNHTRVPMGGNIGMLKVKSANDWTAEAASRPDPVPLWDVVWYEGEMCCLFADSNVGKSILAVQIATEIARQRNVLYCDFEMTDKQFQMRYTNDAGELYKFPIGLSRCEINPELIDADCFEEVIISDIELAARKVEANVVIIDNLTYLCSESEKGDAAARLMMRLVELKKRYGLSVLVLAHTPKRQLASPLTQNDLAGSKKLFNFFDSCFAIGRSAKDESLRYIKQIKVRTGAMEFGSDNVVICEIVKDSNGLLGFAIRDTATEREHLAEPDANDRNLLRHKVRQLRDEGKTIRDIACELGISKSTVSRICQD